MVYQTGYAELACRFWIVRDDVGCDKGRVNGTMPALAFGVVEVTGFQRQSVDLAKSRLLRCLRS